MNELRGKEGNLGERTLRFCPGKGKVELERYERGATMAKVGDKMVCGEVWGGLLLKCLR